MKKKLMLLLFLTSTLLVACSNANQDEIINYVNEGLNSLGELEDEAISTFISVTGQNFTDDQTFVDAMTSEVIPKYEQFVEGLEELNPNLEELSEIHDVYVEGANLQLESFYKAVEGGEQGNEQLIDESNKLREEGSELINEFQVRMEELSEEYNVEYHTED
ncbi:hypothetical protein AB685_21090 [Bacillus sp. LL01]|uniref:hypothetical protein n=1 Tax=Bacillus sp. LL01 TaxID=1665556 RepID=UPI00064D5B67|nr:hypothetical protein [Bacillus sp. LL01]KMJ56586.1 hypothetical protein AB685_21090 [Bacillus sp. LL01]